jgi:hypothetical protein
LEKVDENLPHGVSFYPILDCCYSFATLKGLKQYRPPATFGENIHRIFLSAVDTDNVEASESWSYTWNDQYSDFSYCLMRVLDRVNKQGNDMLMNYPVVRCVDKKMTMRAWIWASKDGSSYHLVNTDSRWIIYKL